MQVKTGGACQLDAPMIDEALKNLDLNAFDLIIIENVGTLSALLNLTRAPGLNPVIRIFETSCRTGDGLEQWCQW